MFKADSGAYSRSGVFAGERFRAALLAFALGTVFIGGVGFAQIDAVHNAAHDGRHGFAFPCH